MTELRPRHHQIIRLAFLGKSYVEIAGALGLTPGAVSCILRSPLARQELEQMQQDAREKTVNTPLQAQLMTELNGCGTEAVRLNRKIMNNPIMDVRLRSKVATHFMDRIVFNKSHEDETQYSYREILRKLSTLEHQPVIINNEVIVATKIEGEGNNGGDSPS